MRPEVPQKWTERNQDDTYTLLYRPTGGKPVFQGMPEAEFPTAIWLEDLLKQRITSVDLDSESLKQPSRPGQGLRFAPGGDNLPWLIDDLQSARPQQFADWIDHIRTALPDLEGIRIVEKPEDRHRYLMVQYRGGLEVPSWMLSDGTLRLIALTLLAYRSGDGEAYLIEEPETHIHPLNIEVVMQSLSSVYGGQVLVSTHSPAILAMTDIDKVLAFSREPVEGTKITAGREHPRLRDWKGEVSLGTLFAGGVLG